MDLCNINEIKALLARHGFHFSKAKGQNFLTQSWVPQNIVLESGVDETCGVLEVGPGIGPLTQQLCRYAKKVVAVEVDRTLQPVLADDIWSRFTTIMKHVYGELVGISTIVAVTAAAVALLIRMISRNQRAVDEATSWLKRIIVTWLVLNTLGFAVAYLQPLIQGGMYNG